MVLNNNRIKSLKEVDPETYEIIQKEDKRQREGLELIASEVWSLFIVSDYSSSLES